MASQILNPPAPPTASWSHSWNSYDNYQLIHQKKLEELMDRGLISRHGLKWDEIPNEPPDIHFHGQVYCRANVTVEVEKLIESERRRGRLYVRGKIYRYHAYQSRRGQVYELFRYDCTPHTPEGQQPAGLEHLHRHLFHLATGELHSREQISLPELPNFHQVIEFAVELGELALAT